MPPSAASKDQQTSKSTRERLIEAATIVFERRGFGQARVQEIASEAGLTTGALYSNFKGKEDLFLAISRQRTEQFIRDASEQLMNTTTREELASALGKGLAATYRHDPGWERLSLESSLHVARDPELHRTFLEQREQARKGMELFMELWEQKNGIKLTQSTSQLAAIFSILLHGLSFERATMGPLSPEQLGEILEEIVRGVLGVTEPAR